MAKKPAATDSNMEISTRLNTGFRDNLVSPFKARISSRPDLINTQKIDKTTDSKEIAKTLTEKTEKISAIEKDQKGGLLTNALTELLKITTELDELNKVISSTSILDENFTALSDRANVLSGRFNKIVGSETFKRATKVLKSLANSEDKSELLNGVKAEFGKQGGDLASAVNFGGVSSVKSLARIFGSLEELRIVEGGEIIKLKRDSSGQVIDDQSQAFKTDLSLNSLSAMISSGLDILNGATQVGSQIEEIRTEATRSVASFMEQLSRNTNNNHLLDLLNTIKSDNLKKSSLDLTV